MEPSSQVADLLVRFYEAFGTGSAAAFDEVVAADADAMVLPTDQPPALRDAWSQVFTRVRGGRLEPGPLRAFAQDGAGWAVDTPTYVHSDGRRLPVRLTAVALQQGGGAWQLVQLHLSVAVPDEVALGGAVRWAAGEPA